MRRILMIAALLLVAVPAMAADVDITVSQSSSFAIDGVQHKTITIGYANAAVDIRAFALDLSVDNGTNIGDTPLSNYKTGESNSVSPGYGIFPGRFRDFVNPSNPNWADANYNPSAPWADAENSGLGWPSIIVELGTLYKEEPNKPGTSGTLFSFDVNSEGQADCNLTVALETLRGGVVKADGAAATVTLPSPTLITFVVPLDPPVSITYPATHTTGRYTVSWPTVSGATGYIVERQLNAGAWTQVYSGAGLSCLADATAGTNVYRVCATDATRQSVWTTGASSTTTYCFGSGVTGYAQWLAVGRPIGWCNYPRQCHGDADGKSQGKSPNIFWVSTNDLTILKAAWNKTAAQLYPNPDDVSSADFDRKTQGKSPNIYSVSTNDLTVLKAYWNTINVPADCVH